MKIIHLVYLITLFCMGCSAPSSPIVPSNETVTVPTTPANVEYSVNDTILEITWDDSSALYTYNIAMTIGRNGNVSDSVYVGVQSPFTLMRSDSTTTYSFKIKALNSQAESDYSEEVTFTYYAKIIDKEPRLLSVEIIDPEIAPGDTVTLRSHWIQYPGAPFNIEWNVSWKIDNSSHGEVTVDDSGSLEPYMVPPKEVLIQSGDTLVYEFKMVIPEDIITESPTTPELLEDAFQPLGLYTPAEYGLPDSSKDAIALIDSIASLDTATKNAIPEAEGLILNVLCQVLTAEFRLYVRTDLTKSVFPMYMDVPVRYNSRLVPIPGIEIDQNSK